MAEKDTNQPGNTSVESDTEKHESTDSKDTTNLQGETPKQLDIDQINQTLQQDTDDSFSAATDDAESKDKAEAEKAVTAANSFRLNKKLAKKRRNGESGDDDDKKIDRQHFLIIVGIITAVLILLTIIATIQTNRLRAETGIGEQKVSKVVKKAPKKQSESSVPAPIMKPKSIKQEYNNLSATQGALNNDMIAMKNDLIDYNAGRTSKAGFSKALDIIGNNAGNSFDSLASKSKANGYASVYSTVQQEYTLLARTITDIQYGKTGDDKIAKFNNASTSMNDLNSEYLSAMQSGLSANHINYENKNHNISF